MSSKCKPLRAQPRSKGDRGERAVIDILRGYGWKTARRNFQSGGQGGGDIIDGPPNVHLEIKYRERAAIWEWIAQAKAEKRPTDIPVVVFRRNGSDWHAVLPLRDLLCLLGDGWPMPEGVREKHRRQILGPDDGRIT